MVTIGEIRKRVDLLDETEPKRAALQSGLDRDVRIWFATRTLAFDAGAAERRGQVEAFAQRQRLTLPTIDAQLAAMHFLTVCRL